MSVIEPSDALKCNNGQQTGGRRFTRSASLRPHLTLWLGLAGVGIRLVRVCDSATTICANTFTAYITVILSVADVLAADVSGIFHRHVS